MNAIVLLKGPLQDSGKFYSTWLSHTYISKFSGWSYRYVTFITNRNFVPELATSTDQGCFLFVFLKMKTLFLLSVEIPALSAPVMEDTFPSESEDADMEDESAETEQKFSRTSGPKTKDPYASDDSWFMPITIAVAVFLPVLFCLCRVR